MKTNGIKRLAAAAILMGLAATTARAANPGSPSVGDRARARMEERRAGAEAAAQDPTGNPALSKARDRVLSYAGSERRGELRRLAHALKVLARKAKDDPALDAAIRSLLSEMARVVEAKVDDLRASLPHAPERLQAKATRLLEDAQVRLERGLQQMASSPADGGRKVVKALLMCTRVQSMVTDDSRRRPARGRVVVNGVLVRRTLLRELEETHRTRMEGGNFWYDRESGAWGQEGGKTEGFVSAGLLIGGPLAADASGGDTDVFINGRRLSQQEVEEIESLIAAKVEAGRHLLHENGQAFTEDGNFIANLREAAEKSDADARDIYYRSTVSDAEAARNGDLEFLMGESYSPFVQ